MPTPTDAAPAASELPIDIYPDTKLRCSCGKETVIRWNGRTYCADDPTWTYDIDPDNDRNSRLWNCGTPPHTSFIVGLRPRDGFR